MAGEVIGFEEIRRLLPQAHPFLMVDKVTELEPDRRIVAWKMVTGNEGFFAGHFPGRAIMPAALILEALAQATILLVHRSAASAGSVPLREGEFFLFGSVHARMHRPVFPGVALRLDVRLLKTFADGGASEGVARVEETPCATAEMYFSKVTLAPLR